nr:hypothetical protein [Candidatus Baldrarchaeota archaeon]
MRIGIMTTWNACCGIFAHAQLVCREWMKMGHEVVVFAPKSERDKKSVPLDVEDEPFVYRNWEMYRYGDRIPDDNELDLYFDPEPILKEDFDVFVVEKPSSTPLGKLCKIFPEIRSKASTIAVVHEGRQIANRNFYKVNFDVYTLFDERYAKLFDRLLPFDRTFIVPFPCHPVVEGDMMKAREKLGLPVDEDLKIVLTYGIRFKYLYEILPVLKELSKKYKLMFLMLSKHTESADIGAKIAKQYSFTDFRYEAPSIERLYTYLHASNAVLLYREPVNGYIPVSSTVCLCLGALRPILCPNINFFETFEDEVIKYSSFRELKERLIDVFENRGINRVLKAARKYVNENSAEKVARRLLELAESSRQIMELITPKVKIPSFFKAYSTV